MFVTVHASTSPEIQDEYVELPSQDLWMTYVRISDVETVSSG